MAVRYTAFRYLADGRFCGWVVVPDGSVLITASCRGPLAGCRARLKAARLNRRGG